MTADDLAVVVKGLTPVIREYVASQVDPLVKTIDDLRERLALAEQRQAVPGPPGEDAEEVDLDELAEKVAALMPAPEPGKDAVVDLEALAQKAAALIPVPANGIDGLPGRDGVGLLETLQDSEGRLRLVLTDGQTKDVGVIKGRDGRDGTDVDMVAVKAMIIDILETWPRPKDGKDGADGFGFNEMSFDRDNRGRPLIVFHRGDLSKSFVIPGFYDQGKWQPDEHYIKGDTVRADGSQFISQVDGPTTRPGLDDQWMLMALRGRQGKPGENGINGKDGRDGRDFSPPPMTKGHY